jgi:hypothetical protein
VPEELPEVKTRSDIQVNAPPVFGTRIIQCPLMKIVIIAESRHGLGFPPAGPCSFFLVQGGAVTAEGIDQPNLPLRPRGHFVPAVSGQLFLGRFVNQFGQSHDYLIKPYISRVAIKSDVLSIIDALAKTH